MKQAARPGFLDEADPIEPLGADATIAPLASPSAGIYVTDLLP
jgi:hypothetical protein